MDRMIDPILIEVFHRFFDGTPASVENIDTSRGDADFRNTVVVTTDEGDKYVLKFASNDFTFPDKMRMWQRTVEEYRRLGYYCPRIFCDKNGDFPSVVYQGHTCFVYAEEFSEYRSLEDRTAADEKRMIEEYDKYLQDIWSMTAKIAAKRLDYTDYPSAYCLFETFCPSDQTDEVLENALAWKSLADALPEEFTEQVNRIWRLWGDNREALKELYGELPTSVFQADLNGTNLLIDEDGRFRGIYDFNLSGKEVFLNYLMRENDSETIPEALRISSRYYTFSEKEKEAALPLYRCLKPLWYTAVRALKEAGNDTEAVRKCLDRAENALTEEIDFRSFMMDHRQVQGIAKETMAYIRTIIVPGMSLLDIRRACEERMLSLGADSFWYWDIGAFVFSGDETTLSVSGREYTTSDRLIGSDDIITIDLSPQREKIWGDYARTIIVENGEVVTSIEKIRNDEWRQGLIMEERLHQELISFATPETTFEELYLHMNALIAQSGFINLDFLGNLGHSIVKEKNERVYIEKGNHAMLSSVEYFTFEPHISIPGSVYGYKKENIYCFSDGRLIEL